MSGESKKKAKTESSSNASQGRHHYATFTNDLQAQRLAALQASAKQCEREELEDASISRRCSVFVSTVSDGIAGVFRSLIFKVSSACLPCFEVMLAFNLLPMGRSSSAAKARRRRDSGSYGTEVVDEECEETALRPSAMRKRSNSFSKALENGDGVESPSSRRARTPSPTGSVVHCPTPPPRRRKPSEDSIESGGGGKRKVAPAPITARHKALMGEKGRVASEMALGTKNKVLVKKTASNERSLSNSALDLRNSSPLGSPRTHKRYRNYGKGAFFPQAE